MPKLVLPGCVEILADIDDIALAMSSDKPITLLDLMPAFGTNSNKVTIGPLLKPIIFPSTPYSEVFFPILQQHHIYLIQLFIFILYKFDFERTLLVED